MALKLFLKKGFREGVFGVWPQELTGVGVYLYNVFMNVFMVLRANKRQPLVLFLAALMLIFFVLITYFYWVPDNLISLVPNNALFYAHLNLSKFHYSGHLAQRWVKNNQALVKDFFSNQSMPENFLDFIEEISFFALPAENNADLPSINLLFQSNKFKEEDFREFFVGNEVKEIAPHTFFVSKQERDLIKERGSLSQDSSFRFINPFQKEVVLVPGYLDLSLISSHLPFQEKQFVKNFELKEFAIIYSLKEKDLFLQMEEKGDFNFLVNDFASEDFWKLKNDFNFVFSFSSNISLEDLKQKISTYLALGRPRERQVVLPDNTSFTEIVISPEEFAFTEKDSIYYWQNSSSLEKNYDFSQLPLEFAFFQEKNCVYFSNNLSLLKEIKNSQLEDKNNQRFLLVEFKNFWIQRLIFSVQDSKIIGRWERK